MTLFQSLQNKFPKEKNSLEKNRGKSNQNSHDIKIQKLKGLKRTLRTQEI